MALNHVVPNSAYTRLSHREPPNCLSLAAQVQLWVVMGGEAVLFHIWYCERLAVIKGREGRNANPLPVCWSLWRFS